MKTNNRILVKVVIAALPLAISFSVQAQSDPSREAMKAAFEACLSENGLSKPAPGQRPSESDRQTMDTCLAAKGITRPPGPPRGEHHHPPQEVNDQDTTAVR